MPKPVNYAELIAGLKQSIAEVKRMRITADSICLTALFCVSTRAKDYMNSLEELRKENKCTPEQLTEAGSLIGGFGEAMKSAMASHTQARQAIATEKNPAQIQADFKQFVAARDSSGMAIYMRKYSSVIKLEQLNYALRLVAANNLPEMIAVLVKAGADIMAPGAESGKIALHSAVSKQHSGAVLRLLRQPNASDYFDPVGQLLFEDKEKNTPLSLLSKLDDRGIQREMIEVIREALSSKLHPATTDKQVQTIRDNLDEIERQVSSTMGL